MPTYNESPQRVTAGLQAIWESLQAAGPGGKLFDIFMLSDTTDPDTWIEEEAAFLALRARTGGNDRIFYRHRQRNTARKAGNIADWVTRFGGSVPAVSDPGRRQRHGGRHADPSGERDGTASRRRADPDLADRYRRHARCSRACSSSPAASMAR